MKDFEEELKKYKKKMLILIGIFAVSSILLLTFCKATKNDIDNCLFIITGAGSLFGIIYNLVSGKRPREKNDYEKSLDSKNLTMYEEYLFHAKKDYEAAKEKGDEIGMTKAQTRINDLELKVEKLRKEKDSKYRY